MAPLFLSGAVHAAAVSGNLLTCAGITVFDRNLPVVFVSNEAPGDAGASPGTPAGVPGVRRGPGTAPGVPGAVLEKLRPDRRSGRDPERDGSSPPRDGLSGAAAPAEETVPGNDAGPAENAREPSGHRERGAGGLGGAGAGGRGEGPSSPAVVAELPKPPYPRYSRIRGEAGTVVLEADVSADGKPAGMRIIRSSGYRRLDDAALDALGKATFVPAMILGKPVASTKRISIRFDIREREE
jgi:protein TonB